MQHEPQRLETGFRFYVRVYAAMFEVFIEIYQEFPDGHWARIELFQAIAPLSLWPDGLCLMFPRPPPLSNI